MIIAAVLAVLLALLGVGFLADIVCARLAERAVVRDVSELFGGPPIVRVRGRPFLIQVVRGRYRHVEVSGDGLRIGQLSGTTLSAHFHDLLAPMRDLIGGRLTCVPCRSLDGELLVPYAELARITSIPGLRLTYDDGRLIASGSLPVPGVSQLARVSGQVHLSVLGGRVRPQVSGLSVAGITLPRLVLAQLMSAFNVPLPLPPLPAGLRVVELTPGPAGLLVRASADDVDLATWGPDPIQ